MTKEEKSHWDKICAFGCIACHLDGIKNTYVSIHHCDGRTKPGAHKKVLALCNGHHQSGNKHPNPDGEPYPSIHPWKKRFETKYGTQQELIELTNRLVYGNDLPEM